MKALSSPYFKIWALVFQRRQNRAENASCYVQRQGDCEEHSERTILPAQEESGASGR